MKTNLIATAILLGTALACPAQSTTPPPDQIPPGSFDPFAAPSSDPNARHAPAPSLKPATREGITFLKTQDSNMLVVTPPQREGFTTLNTSVGESMVLDPAAGKPSTGGSFVAPACHRSAAPLDSSIAGVGIMLEVKDGMFIITDTVPGSTAADSKGIAKGARLIAVGEGPEQPPVLLAGQKLEEVIAMIRGKAGTVVRLVVAAEGKPDTTPRVVTLVRSPLTKLLGKEPGASPQPQGAQLSLNFTNPPDPDSTTRIYPLSSALGKFPGAGASPATEAYVRRETTLMLVIDEAMRTAALGGRDPELVWMRNESNVLIAKGTVAQHDLIAQAIAALEIH